MELTIEGGLLDKKLVRPLLDEANEIVAIMAASRKSASQKIKKSQIANPWPRPGMPGASDGRPDMEQQQKQVNIQITSRQGGRKSKIEELQ